MTLEAHQPRQAPEIAAFSDTVAPPQSELDNALASVDEIFFPVGEKGLSRPPHALHRPKRLPIIRAP